MAISIGIGQFTLVFGINRTSNAVSSMSRSGMLFRALQENQSTWLKHLEKHQEHRSGQFPWLNSGLCPARPALVMSVILYIGSQWTRSVLNLLCSVFVHGRAVDKFFSLGVLAFITHYKQLCAMAMCYILQIQMPKIWGYLSTDLFPDFHQWKFGKRLVLNHRSQQFGYVYMFFPYSLHVPIQCIVFQSGDVSPFVVLHESNLALSRTIAAHCSTSIQHVQTIFLCHTLCVFTI